MIDLKPNEEVCQACGGDGTIELYDEFWTICGWCAGTGKIIARSNKEVSSASTQQEKERDHRDP